MARADKILKPARSIGFSLKENKPSRKGSTRENCYHSMTEMWFAPVCNIDAISESTLDCQQEDSLVRLLLSPFENFHTCVRCSNRIFCIISNYIKKMRTCSLIIYNIYDFILQQARILFLTRL